MSIRKELLDDLEQRRTCLHQGGGESGHAKRRDKGMLSARERLDVFFDAEGFQEWGMHVDHSCHDFGMADKTLACDGVVTGVGQVEGRPVAVYSQDATVGGGSVGQRHARKICDIMDYALEGGMPIVGVNDSGGARIQEGVESLSGYGQIFYRNVLLSGCVPQIGVIAGNCAGGAAYSPALMDFLVMTKDNANMFICGPEVIKAATGVECTMEEIGSASANASISGNVHFVAENDRHAMQIVRDLLSYLPRNNVENPPHFPTKGICLDPDESMNDADPRGPQRDNEHVRCDQPHRGPRTLSGSASRVCPEHHRRVCPCGRSGCRHHRQSAGSQGGHAGHRRLGQGGPVHPVLQRVQHSSADACRRARLSAGSGSGAGGHHPPRCQDAVRVLLRDGSEDHRHYAEGLWRFVSGHVQPRSERPTWCLPGRRRRLR